MASPIIVIGKERNKEYVRIEDENCNSMRTVWTVRHSMDNRG